MDSSSLLAVVGVLEAEGISVWLDGGWGVDALLGYQTRDHDDLDVVVELNNATRIIELVCSLGYAQVAGAPPESFVMVDPNGLQVDVHPVTWDPEGGGVTRWETASSGHIPPRASPDGAAWMANRCGVSVQRCRCSFTQATS
jgi:lincosamide nucleotidyltransferase A/C/D/E